MTPPIEELFTHSLLLNILESIPTRIFWKDLNGTYMGCNTVFAQDSGFSEPDDIVGKSDDDMPWKDLADSYVSNDQNILASGKAMMNHEEYLVIKSKTIWRKVSKAPLYDDDHNIIGIIGMYDDITELKKVQQEAYLAKFVLDNAPLNVSFLDEQARIRYINKEGVRGLGYTHEELLKMSIPDVDPLYPKEVWKDHWQDLKENKMVPVQTIHQRKNGERFPVDVIANYIEFDNLAYNVAFIVDVTEREKALEKLRKSEERFKLAMEGANDGLWDWNLETNHVYYSPRWFSMLGYEPDAFPGTLTTWEKLIHPEDLAAAKQLVSDYLEGKADVYAIEVRMQHKDGHYITVLSRGLKVLDPESQKPTRIIGTHVDITASKNTLHQLEASNTKFETLFNASNDGIFIVSLSGKIIDVNRMSYEHLGYTKEEMLALAINQLAPLENIEERIEHIKEKQFIRFETTTAKKNGTHLPVEVTARIINLGGEDVIFAVSRDITEQKLLEEQLVQSQKMESIGTLVGGIAHDFNNLLAAIQGNLYLATKQSRSNPIALSKLNNIEQLSNRAAEMVQQLLTFARKDTVVMTIFALNEFLQESSRLIKTSVPANIHHCLNVCKDKLIIKGNETQLQQLIINLINNAKDAVAMVDEPQISCTLTSYTATPSFFKKHPEQKHQQFAKLTIEDNGCGISEDNLEHIFEPFFTTKEVGEGTGLGLSMLFGAMQTHEGTIEVESQLNHGTAFHLYFPLTTEEENRNRAPKSKKSDEKYEETILLVDDETSVRQTAAEVLHSMGYQVLEASNGQQALQIFNKQSGQIDLILTDVVMPKMGGHELFAKIRETNHNVPIILVTGYDRSHILKSNIRMENFEVIHKPFNYDVLSEHIQKLLKA